MSSVITLPGQLLTSEKRELLISTAALTEEYLDSPNALFLRSVEGMSDLRLEHLPENKIPFDRHVGDGSPKGMLFGHRPVGVDTDAADQILWQYRPDNPADPEKKYLFVAGHYPTHNLVMEGSDESPVLLVEGTKQPHAVAATLMDEDFTVIGLSGCTGWSIGAWTMPLELATYLDGRTVIIALDADAAHNPLVYEGGEALRQALQSSAEKVRFLRTPGGGKTGLDDYLSALPVAKRSTSLLRAIDRATVYPADKRPKEKKVSTQGSDTASALDSAIGKLAKVVDAAYLSMTEKGELPARIDGKVWMRDTGGLDADLLVRAILSSEETSLGITEDRKVAVYMNGVYDITEGAFASLVSVLLGGYSSPAHIGSALLKAQAMTHADDKWLLPERSPVQMLNVKNGMLDLQTLELKPHDPSYLSTFQLPMEWNPDAECPTYVEWLRDRVGDAQVDVIEEAVSQFLDPSKTPTKALFVFGPPRSGKSTFLRLAKELCGGDSAISGISLQQLSDDHFAAAELRGKPLNICPDLPKDHIRDLSLFKRATGDDPITANKKYGTISTFRSTALFLFSANNLPTVGVSEGAAYFSRLVPAAFPKSYEGSENPAVEDAMMKELQGILVRWAKAYQRRLQRGYQWEPVHPAVTNHFQASSDAVMQFVASACSVGVTQMLTTSGVPGQGTTIIREEKAAFGTSSWCIDGPATISDLFEAFTEFKSAEGANPSRGMHLSTFRSRIELIPGVRVIRDVMGTRRFNIAIKARDDWEDGTSHSNLIPALFPGEVEEEIVDATVDDGNVVDFEVEVLTRKVRKGSFAEHLQRKAAAERQISAPTPEPESREMDYPVVDEPDRERLERND